MIIRIWDRHLEQRASELIARGSRYWKVSGKWDGKRTISGSKCSLTWKNNYNVLQHSRLTVIDINLLNISKIDVSNINQWYMNPERWHSLWINYLLLKHKNLHSYIQYLCKTWVWQPRPVILTLRRWRKKNSWCPLTR